MFCPQAFPGPYSGTVRNFQASIDPAQDEELKISLMPVIPALWEDKAGRSLVVRNSRPVWVWWHVPVVPATQEGLQENPQEEARELLEPKRQKLQ